MGKQKAIAVERMVVLLAAAPAVYKETPMAINRFPISLEPMSFR